MKDLIVRNAVSADRFHIIALYDDVIEMTDGESTSPLWVKGLHPSEEDIDEAIAQKTMFVGTLDDKIVAVLIANDDAATGYENVPWSFDASPEEVAVIHLFAVSPELQHGGIGTQFIQEVFRLLQVDAGLKGVRLDTLESNVPALHFYTKLGMNYLGVCTLKYHDPRVTRFHMFDLLF